MIQTLRPDEARARARQHAGAFSEVILTDLESVPVGRSFGDETGLAHAVPNPDGLGWTLEVAGDQYEELAAAAASRVATAQIEVTLWVHTPDVPDDRFALQRSLRRMERPLPLDGTAELPSGVEVRPFVVGTDEEDWLALNNRAFADHPEQGGWSRSDLEDRMARPWFDSRDLRMVWSGDELVAFNWTKIEQTTRGVDGQIYVIGVDPDHHGRGLGRAATVEGLAHAHAHRGASRASLYVDESNGPGVHLYESLGFEMVERHRAYRWVGDHTIA